MLQLNYKQFGQGQPLIILHGLFGTLDNWQTLARRLSAHYMVFIIDQRNHGRSPHDDAFNYEILAEDLRDFMEAQWIYEAIIVGHSMGGKTAMQFALNYPDMVEKLMVVDIGPQQYKGGHQTIFEALFALNLPTVQNRKEAEAQLATRIDSMAVRQFLLKNLTRNKESGQYEWKMNLPVIYENYQNILAPITSNETYDGETLFVKGGKSDYLSSNDINDIRQLFPKADLHTIAEAGHWIHAEAPDAFFDMILNW